MNAPEREPASSPGPARPDAPASRQDDAVARGLARVAHDVATPVAAMRAALPFLEDETTTRDERDHLIDLLRRNLGRCEDAVAELVALVRALVDRAERPIAARAALERALRDGEDGVACGDVTVGALALSPVLFATLVRALARAGRRLDGAARPLRIDLVRDGGDLALVAAPGDRDPAAPLPRGALPREGAEPVELALLALLAAHCGGRLARDEHQASGTLVCRLPAALVVS